MSHVRCQVSGVRCQVSHVKVVELVGGGSVINGAYPVQFKKQVLNEKKCNVNSDEKESL